MHLKHRFRTAFPRRLAASSAAALSLLALLAAAAAGSSSGAAITVRVEGPNGTLVRSTAVTLPSAVVVKDGNAADSCPGSSAAGALEAATAGHWDGTWSASFDGYLVTSIRGTVFPSSGSEYWSFWLNDKPATAGVCQLTPKPGDRILFFPDCYGTGCPASAPDVLDARAPARARLGALVRVTVTAYSNAAGAPSPAAGALVRLDGASARTDASGVARVRAKRAGHLTLRISAANAIRTELRLCVHRQGAAGCR
jgi:hypothetical protein